MLQGEATIRVTSTARVRRREAVSSLLFSLDSERITSKSLFV